MTHRLLFTDPWRTQTGWISLRVCAKKFEIYGWSALGILHLRFATTLFRVGLVAAIKKPLCPAKFYTIWNASWCCVGPLTEQKPSVKNDMWNCCIKLQIRILWWWICNHLRLHWITHENHFFENNVPKSFRWCIIHEENWFVLVIQRWTKGHPRWVRLLSLVYLRS